MPIAGAPGRQPLGGVTTVVEDHQPLIGNGFVGSSPGLVLMIQKLPSASVLGVTTGVERALDELRPALPGVTIDSSFFRPATYVSSGLHHLALAGAIGVASRSCSCSPCSAWPGRPWLVWSASSSRS